MARLTVRGLLEGKGVQRRTQVYVRNATEAQACAEAGVEMLVAAEWPEVGSNKLASIRAAAPDAFITFGLPFYGPAGPLEVLREAYRLQELGADAVYCSYGFDTVETLAKEYVPVVGHVGLVPYRSTWTGGMRAVGTTAAEAAEVLATTRRYEECGAFAVEMEVVPREVAEAICARTKMLVIGMGAGPSTDVQYLFATDVLGDNEGHVPRHAKVYRDFASEHRRLYTESVGAFRELVDDVRSGAYPAREHQVVMRPAELERFREGLADQS